MTIASLQRKLKIKDDGRLGPVTIKKFGEQNKLNNFQLAHFFGQCDHESMGFTAFKENLNYTAPRLLQIFPKYFSEKTAIIYSRKPEMIANRVYSNRMGNGDEKSGDGWKYIGRTPIHLTGKSNYEEASKHFKVDFVSNPELTLEYGFEIALWFFRKNNIFEMCVDVSDATIAKVTRKINGGVNGLEHRIKLTKKYFHEN
jgi:putative chitinase